MPEWLYDLPMQELNKLKFPLGSEKQNQKKKQPLGFHTEKVPVVKTNKSKIIKGCPTKT